MSDRLTLVVFKDHLSSRTLTVRQGWLRVFGLTLLGVIGLTVISAALFLSTYRRNMTTGSVGNANRAEDLEKELNETKIAYESLKQNAVNSISSGALAGAANSFNALPSDAVLERLPGVETLAFRLEPIKAQWKGMTLQIRTAIEYSREDGGNQQGHFIILARGPQALHAYPEGVFNPAGNSFLMKPDSGEFFSVSRYREIKAELGPFARKDDVQSIEIFVFDPKKRLIFLNRLALESVPTKSAPEPVVTAAAPKKAKAIPVEEVVKPPVTPDSAPVVPEITEPTATGDAP